MAKRTIGVALVLAVALVAMPGFIYGQEKTDPSESSTRAPRIRSARVAMKAIIPEIELKDKPFEKVIARIREACGANMVVDWNALEGVGIKKDSLVSLSLVEISVGDTLGQAIHQLKPTAPVLAYVDSNIIYITTQAEADKRLVTYTYDVKDLVGTQINQLFPQNTNNNNNNNNNGNNGNNQNNNSYNQNNNTNNNGQSGNNQQTLAQQVQQAQNQDAQNLINVVKSSVRPDIWSDGKGGGGPATITYFSGHLVISAPIYVLEAIGGPVPGH